MSTVELETPENILDLSDEEFMKLDPSSLPEAPVSKEGADGQSTDVRADEGSGDGDDGATAGTEGAAATEGTEAGATESTVFEESGSKDPAPEAKDKESQDSDKPTESADGIDYKAAYERLMAPFKANGREMKVTSVEEAMSLMQMGANYNKKMAALKPSLKVLKLLENNDLLSEEKLGFLIDLSKKDPKAIQKLVKDSGLDPLDMDVSKESDYKPTSYKVDDREMELDEVLSQIQDTPTYAKTVDVVSTQWDAKSKQIVANNPQLLRVINDHMASGVYDLISTEVDRERMLGRLSGLSDLEAYKTVGDALHAAGRFNHLGGGNETNPAQNTARPAPVRKANEADLKNRRRAASPTTGSPASNPEPTVNPLELSDDEFLKQLNRKFR